MGRFFSMNSEQEAYLRELLDLLADTVKEPVTVEDIGLRFGQAQCLVREARDVLGMPEVKGLEAPTEEEQQMAETWLENANLLDTPALDVKPEEVEGLIRQIEKRMLEEN